MSQMNASPDDIDITSLWAALKSSLLKLTAVSGIAAAATFGVLSTMAPRYTSEAQMQIVAKTDPLPQDNANRSSGDVTIKVDPAAVNTHVKALTASDLLIQVAKEMGLSKRAEFNSAVGDLDAFTGFQRKLGMAGPRPGETDEDRVLANVTKQLEVSSPKESRAINIRFTSADSELAANFANKLAGSYKSGIEDDSIGETSKAFKALEPKVEALRKEVIETNALVEKTRVEIDRTIGGQQRTTLIDQRMSELSTELTKADAVKNDADVKWKMAKELSGTNTTMPELQKSPLIQNLETQRSRLERQISELSASLLPGHPRMQQLNADLGGLKRQLTAEISKFSQGLEKEARSASLRVDAIKNQINELKSKVVNTSGDDAKLKSLEATAKSKQVELERLEKRLQDLRTTMSTRTVATEATLVTKARSSVQPTFPKKVPFSLLAMVGTFLMGLAWVVTRELLLGSRGGAKSPAGGPGRGGVGAGGATAALGGRLAIAHSPGAAAGYATASASASAAAEAKAAADAQSAASSAALAARSAAVLGKGAKPAAEASASVGPAPGSISVDTTIARLLKNGGAQPGYRTLIAGDTMIADPSEEAVDVAIGLSRAGKQVVLVDWNMAGKGFAESIGVPRKPGITDLLAGSVSFEDVIARVPGSEAHFIASGDPLADAASVDADRLNLVLDALDEAYDHIVIAGVYGSTQALFEQIQGRFDAGVTVIDSKRRAPVTEDAPGSFLGFEVTDLDIIKIDRTSADASAAKRKPGNGARPAAGELRT
jgi:polysaccharide biosynthesis transport protein